jgi:hypothetical protein
VKPNRECLLTDLSKLLPARFPGWFQCQIDFAGLRKWYILPRDSLADDLRPMLAAVFLCLKNFIKEHDGSLKQCVQADVFFVQLIGSRRCKDANSGG